MIKPIVSDSGPLIALFNRSDRHNAKALEFVKQNRAPLYTTVAVITEVAYMLDFDVRAQRDFFEFITRGGLRVVDIKVDDIERIWRMMETYEDLPMDFADATVVCACEKLNTEQIISVDQDFSVYRFLHRRRFRNLLTV